MTEDGTVSEQERHVHQLLVRAHGSISAFSCRKRFAEHFERTGEVTRYMQALAKDAGVGIVDLAEERRARRSNVIAFRAHRDGPEAA